MAKTKVTPEINFDLSDTEASPVVGRVDGEEVRGEQKVRSMGGRLGFRADTEGMSYGAGVSGGTAKGELDLPSVLEQFGAPDKVKFGSGKIKPQDYDAFLEMADIFGIEGATARVEAGYTPSDYEEDKKRIALKLKYNFAEGGAVPMKEQMSMFEDGGLMDEGGSIDPVSGNDVPPGSTQEEVRDDIPAQLSEGEFVFPADVVRFIGLGNLMQMRQQAKMGLKQMEAMGQMGNSDEATMPDDLPFDVNDLDMEDEDEYNDRQEFAVGGMPSNIQTQQSSFADYTLPTYNNNMVQPTNTMYTPTTQQYTPVASPTTTFDFGAMDGVASGPPDEYKTYTNESGQQISVPFKDGKVLSTFTVPEGYKLKTEEVKVEKDTNTAPSTSALPESGGQSDEYPDGPPESFATTDMRGVGYDRSKIDNDLLTTELTNIGKGQAKVLASAYSPVAKAAQLAKSDIKNKVATSDKLSGIVDVKGTVRDANNEFLTSQKVAIDSFFNDPKYADVKTENLHNLSPEVKQALAVEIQTNRISLENSMKGKSQAELDAEKTSLADKYGLTTSVRDPRTNKDREKTYGQIYAEARVAQKRRDEAKAAKAAADAAAADRRSRGMGYGLGGEYGEGSGSMGGSEAEQKGAEEGGYQTSTGEAMVARGGLMDKDKLTKQMKRSGLASK